MSKPGAGGGGGSSSKYDWRKMDNIRVIGRFRPANETERRDERKSSYKDEPPNYVNPQVVKLNRAKQPPFKATLDHIFRDNSRQKHVFNLVGRPMVQAVMEGYNATIFAYGQTGSGKTFTMFGPNSENLGLVPRCCTYLFQQLNKRSKGVDSEISEWQMSAEFVQIYKESLLDLLDPKKRQRLRVRINFQTDTPYVENLKSVGINNMVELLSTLSEAQSHRKVASHKLNADSSRSHMLVMLTLEQKMVDGSIKRSKLNFGDLAGSEDITKALGPHPDPSKLAEAIAINTSLTALTTAINYLSKGQRPSYRSSLLTHILQDSLGGNSKTTMIVNASPHSMNRQETVRTLRFAQQAKTVVNKARVNKELTKAQLTARIAELEAENSTLKARVIELETQLVENGIQVTLTRGLYEDDSKRSETVGSEWDIGEGGMSFKRAPIPKMKPGVQPVKAIDFQLEIEMQSERNLISKDVGRVELSEAIQHIAGRTKSGSVAVSMSSLMKEIESLEGQLAAQRQENRNIAESRVQLEAELNAMQNELVETKERFDETQKVHASLKRTNDVLEQRMKQMTDQVAAIQNREDADQKEREKDMERLQRKVDMHIRDKRDLQKQVTQLEIEVETLGKENTSLSSQLVAARKNTPAVKLTGPAVTDEQGDLQLEEEEKNLPPAELLLHRFAAAEVNDFRMEPEQRMKKTGKMMKELSDDIGALMDVWMPQRKGAMRSKALVFRVRQLIGHFNVLVNQLKQAEGGTLQDMKLKLKQKERQIEELKKSNDAVLQLQDDLAEKDEVIGDLKEQLRAKNYELEAMEEQKAEVQTHMDDIVRQVGYLEKELERARFSSVGLNSMPGMASLQASLKQPGTTSPNLSVMQEEKEFSESYDITPTASIEPANNSIGPMHSFPTRDFTGQKPRTRASTSWRETLQVGQKLDALDEGGLWWTATAVQIKDELIQVRYDGWGDQYDEWISRNSPRLAVYGSRYYTKKDGKKVVKEGEMQKEGKRFRTWRRRYFTLFDNGTMTYYQDKGATDPIGSFNVKEMTSTRREELTRKQLPGFAINTGERVWRFICDNEQDVRDWLHSIQLVGTGAYDDDATPVQ